MATTGPRQPWRLGILSAVGMGMLTSATNVAINYATTEASVFRWAAVVVLTLTSGFGVAFFQSRNGNSETRRTDRPAVHIRIVGNTIDIKTYSEDVALQSGYIDQWIRSARREIEGPRSEEGADGE